MAQERRFQEIIEGQREYFNTGATLPLRFRLRQLQALHRVLDDHEDVLAAAARSDFGKPEFETVAHEIEVVKEEIRFLSRRLPGLMKRRRVSTPLHSFPARNYRMYRPYGISLIIGAWNYPVLLSMLPLAGSIAAGNCCVLKPSEMAPHVSGLLRELIEGAFERSYLTVVEGGVEESQQLLEEKSDHIFFTGSPRVGRIIMESAAKHLSAVTLELGGKSPCIVERDADVVLASRRIAWGKWINAGQTCVCPDYLYVHESVKDRLIEGIVHNIGLFYGADPMKSPDYCRIINDRHVERLQQLIDRDKVVYGGKVDRAAGKVAPTIMDRVTWDDPVMQEEIFGPVLPILSYSALDEVASVLQRKPVPLALYLFTRSRRTQRMVTTQFRYGCSAINDVVLQYGLSQLPVGGIGESGIGRYHGVESFKNFSHLVGIMKKGSWLDMRFRYPPYRDKLKWVKLVFRL